MKPVRIEVAPETDVELRLQLALEIALLRRPGWTEEVAKRLVAVLGILHAAGAIKDSVEGGEWVASLEKRAT